MFEVVNYLNTARKNEDIFRNILCDLKDNRNERPMGMFVPEDLDVESSVEEIFTKYSTGRRFGIFTIIDFVVSGSKAIITFEDVAIMSGGGGTLEYSLDGTDVCWTKSVSSFMS